MLNTSGLTFVKLPNSELHCLKISNEFCEALISFQGAQILEFYSKKKNKDLLWLSDLNQYQQHKAIRGGIPLCFPWFGASKDNRDFPAHGFARNLIWNLLDVTVDVTGHHIIFELNDCLETRQYWDASFNLQMAIHCGEELKLEFKLTNTDDKAIEFEFMWHSYFPAETQNAKVLGLENTRYVDQLDANKTHNQLEQNIEFIAEFDRIYPKTAGQFVLEQNVNQRIFIESSAQSAVIWNPWVDKAKRLADVRDDAWRDFICIENGQLGTEKVILGCGRLVSYSLLISC